MSELLAFDLATDLTRLRTAPARGVTRI